MKMAVAMTTFARSGRIGEPLHHASTPATISVIAETTALTSVGMVAPASGRAAQVLLQEASLIAVEQMADQAAVEIGGAEQPVGDRKGQVHVDLHHQPAVVMGRMMATQRVDERAMAHEPVLVYMAAEIHELVDEIHAGRHAHEQPADIGRQQRAERGGRGQRHQDEDDQRVRRKHGDAPVLVVAEAHLIVGEELMMIERVTLIDRAQSLDVHRAVHDKSVHCPFEQVGEQEGERHREPLQRRHVVDVRDVDIEHRRAHGVDDGDVEVAVVPSDDAGAVLLAKVDLPLADHRLPPHSLSVSRQVLLGLSDESFDVAGSQRPVIVEVGDHRLHERRGQAYRAHLVAEVVVEDRKRELLRAVALVGPFEAIAGEAIDLIVLVERPAIGRHDQAVDGAPAFVGRHRGHATRRENSSGSTLPPDSTATAMRPRTSILPASSAANATAPPGSTTSLSSRNAKPTARPTSSSVAATPAPTSSRLISKVMRPGDCAISASQIVPVSAALRSRRPVANERAWSSKPAGSAVTTCAAGTRALTASATPAVRPPPDAFTITTSGASPSAARSSTISRPVVP